MGGVNGLIVLADADKDKAVDCIVNGAFFAAGQRCTATSRIIVEEAVADDLAQRLIARIADLPMGDPRAPGTAIGPLVSLRQNEGVAAAVRAVEAEGLRPAAEVGRASVRERVCQYVEIWWVAGTLKKKQKR